MKNQNQKKRKMTRSKLGEREDPPRYVPTPEQIAEECAKIKEENSKNQKPRNESGTHSRAPKTIHKSHTHHWDFD